ncbi:FadR/GntR family transcriptional regulator [Paenibacillus sp. EPM92]|uniref:FadR/GntR family transcriptional regulator n=1 Tax=Paenibacillus sp. EPM92 TaxID=1561195 RepID=UPI0019157A01|nr:FadR/GntR family transcriptional regulator [Paenibacillus sp. EPM92]
MTAVNKNHRMFEQVLHQFREYTSSRNLAAGDKLMTEREMAAYLQVSRSSVREALRILEMFDVIYSKPGEGTILKTPHIPKILTTMLQFFTIPTETSIELLESRKVLEGGVAKLAAKRRKEADIRLLQNAVERMRSASDLQAQIQADLDFHLFLAKAAYNNTLSDILVLVSDLVTPNLYTTRLQTQEIAGVNDDFARQHQTILQAVIDKNGHRAAEEMERHIEHTIDLMKALNRFPAE